MAKKEVTRTITLQIFAGKANPAPPVGTALGPAGINIQDFCKQFNDATKDMNGDKVTVVIRVFDDRSFDFKVKTPPTSFLLKKVANLQKASSKGANEVVATITKEQLRQVAETKLPDLNANTIEAAMKEIEGTARNMGIAVKGLNDAELQEQAKEASIEEALKAKREAELTELEEEQAKSVDTSSVEVVTEKAKEENVEK